MTTCDINNCLDAEASISLSGDNVKGINIAELKNVNMSLDDLAKLLNISTLELEPKNNWFFYKGQLYYFKYIYYAFRVINELLGEYLCGYMDIPTVEYSLALENNKIMGVLSKNFRNLNKKYYQAAAVPSKYLEVFSDALERHRITKQRKAIDKILIKDIYSYLSDRERNTLISFGFLKRARIEKSIDYELSFYDPDMSCTLEKEEYKYYNPLFLDETLFESQAITLDTIKAMMEYDTYLISQYEKILDFDIAKALKDIEDKHNFCISEELKDYYKFFDRTRKEELVNHLGH